jgi:hypothetical protein
MPTVLRPLSTPKTKAKVHKSAHYSTLIATSLLIYLFSQYLHLRTRYQSLLAWWAAWPSPKSKLVSITQIVATYASTPLSVYYTWTTSPSGRLNVAQSDFFLNRLMRHAYTENAAYPRSELPGTFLKPSHLTDSACYTQQAYGSTRAFREWLGQTRVPWATNATAAYTTDVAYGQQADTGQWGVYPTASDIAGWIDKFEEWCGLRTGGQRPYTPGNKTLFTGGGNADGSTDGVPYTVNSSVFTADDSTPGAHDSPHGQFSKRVGRGTGFAVDIRLPQQLGRGPEHRPRPGRARLS